MFESVGWGEIFVLVVAGLFILGPERLPSAAAWLGRAIRQVREYATGARDQLRHELGPEFDELRKPLEDLRGLRDLHPRTAVRRALFDDDPASPPTDTGLKPNGYAGANGSTAKPPSSVPPVSLPPTPLPPTLLPPTPLPPTPLPLSPDERPPIDPDAT